MTEKVPLNAILNLLRKEFDPQVLKEAKMRQAAVWEGKEPDYLPLVIAGQTPEQPDYPVYNLKEQFFDPEKMFYEQLWTVLKFLRGKTDAVPSVRVNFGTGFLVSIFGLEQEVFPDKMPWLSNHLSKDEILRLTLKSLEPLCEKGLLPDCKRYIQFYKEHLRGTPVKIYMPDTQGPFDLAHLVFGDTIFTELYDDPEFIRHLLTLTSYVYREASLLIKSWIGESPRSGYHSGNLYMTGCGVRCCEDTTTLLSPRLIRLVVPFVQDAIAPFGGWIHFCGDGRHLLELLLSLPEVKGINFGNPERFDWQVTMSQIAKAGKVYYGTIPRREKESLSEYFQRVLSSLKRKGNLIFCPHFEKGETAQDTLSLWHRVQDRLL